MNIKKAEEIRDKFANNTNPSEDEIFAFTEAMDYLIDKRKDPDDMMFLGGVYYEMRKYDLALKYYEMAATMNHVPAYECLGYIWYYGRTGEKDYKKAFECFSKASEKGDIVARYKLADMYKNGYYVKKDQKKYEKMIEDMYDDLEEYKETGYINSFAPIPEINTRLAKIKTSRGEVEDAVDLYLEAKYVLAQRIELNAFFGNLNIMMWLIDDLYNLIEFDKDDFDFYDLYYLLKTPHKIKFIYKNKEYFLESVKEGDECSVNFNDKWFYNRKDFFEKATIGNKKLTSLYDDLYGFEVVK